MTLTETDRTTADTAEIDTIDQERARTAVEQDAPAGAQLRAATSRPFVIYLSVFVAALALRLFEIRRSYDIFIDEITYSAIGRSVADGHGVLLYGQPFNLHPPTVFAVLGGVERWFGLTDVSADQLVLDLRPVVAVFGAGIVVLGTLTARLCGAGPVAAGVVAAALALDPFAISFDSRVMLEAPAQLFVLACVALVLLGTRLLEDGRRAAARWTTLGAGVCAGGAFTSKETFGLVLAALLLLLMIVPRLVSRRHASGVLAVGAACYLAVSAVTWASTGFAPWWHAHTDGLNRLVGTHQSTGFNASSTKVSLVSRIAANVGQFGVTYAVLVVGGLVTLVQVYGLVRTRVWRGRTVDAVQRRYTVLTLWALASCGYLVYATGVGSIEEQMYYIPLLAVILVLGVGLSRVSWTPVWRRAIAALVAVALLFQGAVWARTHTTDRNLYEQFFNWERVNIVAGARIGLTELSAQFVLGHVSIGTWSTLAQLTRHHADYVLVQSSLVEQGYSPMTPATLDELRAKARVAFSASAPGEGTLYLFDLRSLDGGA